MMNRCVDDRRSLHVLCCIGLPRDFRAIRRGSVLGVIRIPGEDFVVREAGLFGEVHQTGRVLHGVDCSAPVAFERAGCFRPDRSMSDLRLRLVRNVHLFEVAEAWRAIRRSSAVAGRRERRIRPQGGDGRDCHWRNGDRSNLDRLRSLDPHAVPELACEIGRDIRD